MELYLSKSKYCNAVQCPKMLWMQLNRPELFDDSVMDEAILEKGQEVGDLARGLFGVYTVVEFGDYPDMLKQTQELLENGTEIIAEASFAYKGLFCRVDILRNLGGNKCELYEVKHSAMRHVSQYRHLADSEKGRGIERRYGSITGRYVIYRGEHFEDGMVRYLNVEEYLKGLGEASG